eukprot:GHVP01012039.1.p1 GENE.GHVP01012039.1~~GHVP01012039.1.p1  ORF type:complete len:128 (+),score=16.77 GHVP01012039.1:465-848(+)
MCEGWNMDDSGIGDILTPYYVYVHESATNKLFSDHDHCGRTYRFGSAGKLVMVAGTTAAGTDGDGLELIMRQEDCPNLAECDLEGYAFWTGSDARFPPSTTTSTTSEDPEDSTFFAAVGLTLLALLA